MPLSQNEHTYALNTLVAYFIYDELRFYRDRWNEVELNCNPMATQISSSASAFSNFPIAGASSSTSSSSSPPNLRDSRVNGIIRPDEYVTCTLDNLAPATAYSAYITIATLIKHEGAQSGRFNFTTKPSSKWIRHIKLIVIYANALLYVYSCSLSFEMHKFYFCYNNANQLCR